MAIAVKANCNTCGGERNTFVRARYSIPGRNEDGLEWRTTMEILECCGCENLSMRREFWFCGLAGITTYWPPKQAYTPDWGSRLEDDSLRRAMREVYVASNQGLVMLASIGVRTLLDRAFFLLLGEDHNSFAEQLKVMVKKGLLLSSEKEIFQSIVDVGSAAAHRAHVPSQETLIKILKAAESFLYQKFILPGEAKAVKRETPSRGSQAGSTGVRDQP